MKLLLSNPYQEKMDVEQAVLGHLLFLSMEKVERMGYEFRSDITNYVNQSAVAPLSKYPPAQISVMAKRVDDMAVGMLRDLNPDNDMTSLFAVVRFILKLVDEGYAIEPRSQPVLVSLMLMDDIKDDKIGPAVWKMEERKWDDLAGTMLIRAKLLGNFLLA